MAAEEKNLTLYLPFDESNGSAVAYDYSSNRNDGVVDKCSFRQGKIGNCVHFPGSGKVEVSKQMLNFAQDFTISTLVKGSVQNGDTQPTKFGWIIVFTGIEKYIEKWIDVTSEVWVHLVLVKIGRYLRYYVDGALIGEDVILDTKLEGVGLLQDIYSTDLGKGDLDETQFYQAALTQEEILSLFDSASTLEHYLDGYNFKDFGVRVSKSGGIVDGLKMKTPFSVNWDDEHGETLDLSRPRFEGRDITLDCYIKADGKVDFVNKVNNFLSIFRSPGTHRLMIDINPTKPLVYEVYSPNGVQVSKTWNDTIMVGTFQIKMREPEPVKRVLKHIRISEATREISITFKSSKYFNIHWGDGTHSFDIGGDGIVTAKHVYQANGNYFPIITGVIEDMKEFSTNAIMIWSIL